MTLYVGIDGGGSKTRTVAVDASGEVRLDHLSDGCDLPSRGPAQVRRVLTEIRSAVDDVVGADERVLVTAGLPALGETDAWDAQLRRLTSEALLGWQVTLRNDVRLALEGALPAVAGVLVLSGTGSMAWGKTADGREARTGGWGPLLGDEGSGFEIGRKALAAALMAADGRGPATRLRETLPAALGVDDAKGVLSVLGTLPEASRYRVAALVPVVMDAASGGDTVARTLVEGAASDLVLHVEAVMRRLGLPPDRPVSYAGGCFRAPPLLDAFLAALACAGFTDARPPRTSPAFGGVLLSGLRPERLPDDPSEAAAKKRRDG